MRNLHIDIETYSSVDLATSGVYNYAASPDFEILLFAYCFDNTPVSVVDLIQGEVLPKEVLDALANPEVIKHAHNALFERVCLRAHGINVPAEQWQCSAVKAATCGLPLSLGALTEILHLGAEGKMTEGKALIRYFCLPCKPSKANGGRFRNLPEHDLEKWSLFKTYCGQDVHAELAALEQLRDYATPEAEAAFYALDQKINDTGVEVDTHFAQRCIALDNEHKANVIEEMRELTGLDNPNSTKPLAEWLTSQTGQSVKSIAKGDLVKLLVATRSAAVRRVIQLRQEASKTSTKKYNAMIACAGEDKRARGLFQFCGAGRTGRWAGRRIQLQNLPQNHLDDLDQTRYLFKHGEYAELKKLDKLSMPSYLSQLVRTALVAKEGHTFAVADFSAIEARVIAWLAGEKWRIEVFHTHGKIYEASAAAMFNVPIEEVTKGSDLRAKGKIAELALGFGGSVGALRAMGGGTEDMSEQELKQLVTLWRAKNPAIVRLWRNVEAAALNAVSTGKTTPLHTYYAGLVFKYDGTVLSIRLHSGRELRYWRAKIDLNKYGNECILYQGMDPDTKQWGWVDTYGGKLVENIVQATARDLLASALLSVDRHLGYPIALHVHDEIACEVPLEGADVSLERLCAQMAAPVEWAPGLPLAADGFITTIYKKD